MIAAIYARKSAEQNGGADEQKSRAWKMTRTDADRILDNERLDAEIEFEEMSVEDVREKARTYREDSARRDVTTPNDGRLNVSHFAAGAAAIEAADTR